MVDMNALERQLADESLRIVGPEPTVNDAAIFTAITATQSPKWRFQPTFSAAKFVVAGAIVALFGGFLLAGVMSQRSDEQVPAVGASAFATPSEPDKTTSPVRDAGTFTPVGWLDEARSGHTATLLPDGRVLVIGGGDPIDSLESPHPGTRLASAEILDPVTGTAEPTGSLAVGRWGHTATLLSDGRVLVAGGIGEDAVLDSLEVWDPATGTFASAGSLAEKREFHTATLLSDGRVFIVGDVAGAGGGIAEVWDPDTSLSSTVGRISGLRWYHSATLLPDGRVLVIGSGTAELWDPATGQFESTGPSSFHLGHTATLLSDGRVLVAGGNRGWSPPVEAEIWDPRTGTFTTAGPLRMGSADHTATLLPDGRVLFVGGQTFEGGGVWRDRPVAAEVWDPATDTTRPGGSTGKRINHTATLLLDGRVLIVGGYDEALGLSSSADVWEPTTDDLLADEVAITVAATPDLLPGVDLVTEEVEPGVYRLLSDGVRDLAGIGSDRDGAVVAGLDGSVWHFRSDGFYRLGEEPTYGWGDQRRVFAEDDIEVGPDGTIWRVPDPRGANEKQSVRRGDVRLLSFDGEDWTVRLEQPTEGGRGAVLEVEVLPDGEVWTVWVTGGMGTSAGQR